MRESALLFPFSRRKERQRDEEEEEEEEEEEGGYICSSAVKEKIQEINK